MLSVCDYSSIESRFVGWLTGCRWINDTFAQGLDTYKKMAVEIFDVPYDAVTKKQRKFCKPVVLAGPYGQWVEGLQRYAINFGVNLSPEEAKHHVETFRSRCFEIKDFWRWLEDGVITAVQHGEIIEGYRLRIQVVGEFLAIQLPSGRRLWYHQPLVEKKMMPWGKEKWVLTYMGMNEDRHSWTRLSAHKGLLTENIVQAGANDILRFGMRRLLNEGIDLRGHVHDEDIALGSVLPDMQRIMAIPPPWAPDLLLEADGYQSRHYTKV